MSNSYKSFIRKMKRAMVETHISPGKAAKLVGVSLTTLYNWISLRTVMSGDDMLKVIKMIMGGWHEIA